jgi:hypothetical protein
MECVHFPRGGAAHFSQSIHLQQQPKPLSEFCLISGPVEVQILRWDMLGLRYAVQAILFPSCSVVTLVKTVHGAICGPQSFELYAGSCMFALRQRGYAH